MGTDSLAQTASRWLTSRTMDAFFEILRHTEDDIGPYLAQRFNELVEHPLVGVAETCGFVAGLVLVKDKAHKTPFASELSVGMVCRKHCFNNGLIMRAVGDRMIVAPPLIMDEALVDELLARIRFCLDRTLADLTQRGWLPQG